MAGLLLLLCLSGCTSRTTGEPLPDRASTATPSPAPTVHASTPTATPSPAFTPTPTPSLTVSGDYDNPAVHADGRYALQLAGARVAATFATSGSPVEHWARRTVPQPLFTIPESFRPPYSIRRTVEGTPVHADGTPDPARTAPHRFLLRVDPDGTVHYVDDGRVQGAGNLAYVLHTVWNIRPPPPTSTPIRIPTSTPTSTATPTPTPTPTFVPAVPSPTPSLTVSGTYDNRVEHVDGRYELQLAGARVAATFAASRSPVSYWAREVAAPLFTVPEPFRPPYPILRTAEGIPVRADGTADPDHPEPRRFLLRVDPDGTVHYVDDAQVEGEDRQAYCLNLVGMTGVGGAIGDLRPPAGIAIGTLRAPAGGPAPPPPSRCAAAPEHVGRFLAYSLHTTWGTTPAANDRAVLEILDRHWFRRTRLSTVPSPVQFEVPAHSEIKGGTFPAARVGAFVTFNADGRVTALGAPTNEPKALAGAPVYDFHAPLLPELGQLHHLEHLDLGNPTGFKHRAMGRGPRSLTGAIPPQLLRLPRLRHLDLQGQLLAWTLPADIGHLVSLEYLDLRNNWLSGPLPPELGRLASLKHLDLGGNDFTEPLPPEWGQLTSLQSLSLSNNQLTGPLPPEWGQLANLQSLSLSDNQLTGPLPPAWGQLANLQSLSLSDNQLTGPLPPAWGQLANLQSLSLSDNQLTGSLPPEWGQLASLRRLYLGSNQLTGSLPPEWGQLANLEHLNVSHNQLTGSFPPELGQLANLDVLRLEHNQLTGPLPTATPVPLPTPIPCVPTPVAPSRPPSLTRSGDYDNLTEHADGRYELQLSGTRVAATFSTTRSPVPHAVREVPQPLFTVPEPFRPPYAILRTAVGTPVRADGTPDPDHPEPRRFLLRVDPDGTAHYADDAHVEGVGFLAYALDMVWGTTPAANDRTVLEILDRHWFGEPLLLACPPPGHHVTLDADGRVTALDTKGRFLDGYLPPELGQLYRLEHLDLSNAPRRHFHFEEAVVRRLRGRLSRLSDVTETDFEWVREQGGTPLTLYGAIPPQLGQLSRLRYLDLGFNLLTGTFPPEIGRLAALEHLDLGDNWLTGPLPPEWGQLRNLVHLNLGDNWLTGPLPPEWGQLASLQELHLWGNQLTGPLPPEWGQLASLQRLYLSHHQLTGPLPPEWGQLASLQELTLWHNQLTGPLPPEWGQLASLQKLDLGSNRLSGPLPPEWVQLASLQKLDLGSNRLSGPLPPEWVQLASLQKLDLGSNRLSGPLPPEWGRLTSLRWLDLHGNQLMGPLPPEWVQLANLQWLKQIDLRDNQLTGCFPGIAAWYASSFQHDLPSCSPAVEQG